MEDGDLLSETSSVSADAKKVRATPHPEGEDDLLTVAQEGNKKDTNNSAEYPLETFTNWNVTGERYYVEAPIDRLGMFAFHLRTHITSLILAGNPAISYLQQHRSDRLTVAALFFSWLGLEAFLFALVVSNLWLFDARLGRLLALIMAIGFFVSGSLKVLLCLPRPPSPPVTELAKEDYDWAWPSNHALLGTAFPWFIWIYASNHYDLSFIQSIVLLLAIFTWNAGVMWSRVYLGVHSPCDVLAGWTMGCVLLFVVSGFSDRAHEFFITNQSGPLYFIFAAAVFLYVHPRAWPETQSFGEVVSVVVGAFVGIFGTRQLHVAGETAHISLLETNPDSPIISYLIRFLIGSAIVAVTRAIIKPVTKKAVKTIYSYLDLPYYSYSDYCKRVQQPTKRYTHRMRFRPVAGKVDENSDNRPYDVDLPTKAVVYGWIGFLVAEGCPAVFAAIGI